MPALAAAGKILPPRARSAPTIRPRSRARGTPAPSGLQQIRLYCPQRRARQQHCVERRRSRRLIASAPSAVRGFADERRDRALARRLQIESAARALIAQRTRSTPPHGTRNRALSETSVPSSRLKRFFPFFPQITDSAHLPRQAAANSDTLSAQNPAPHAPHRKPPTHPSAPIAPPTTTPSPHVRRPTLPPSFPVAAPHSRRRGPPRSPPHRAHTPRTRHRGPQDD